MSYRRILFSLFVLLVFASSTIEVISEFASGETLSTMIDDLSWFLLSAIVLILFLIEHIMQQRSLKRLEGQLDKTRGQLTQIDESSKRLASEFRFVIQKQFDAWQLSISEQDVALGLLKGFSFREIAALRNTNEKTVRQQASSLYKKAGVSSRHELAAWFFEDMLVPA